MGDVNVCARHAALLVERPRAKGLLFLGFL